MSWRNRIGLPRASLRSGAAMLCVLGFALAATGCGMRPLYGPTPSGETTQALMNQINVAPIPGRVGQRVRNELIFVNSGGGEPAPPKYKLDIVLTESLSKELVQHSGEATGETVFLHAQYKLVDISKGTVLFSGKAIARKTFDRYDRTFSNVRAQYDAENDAAQDLAGTIKTQIAGHLATSST